MEGPDSWRLLDCTAVSSHSWDLQKNIEPGARRVPATSDDEGCFGSYCCWDRVEGESARLLGEMQVYNITSTS